MLKKPYLLFLGDAPDQLAAKVAQGIYDWRREDVVGQFKLENCQANLPIATLSLQEAKDQGAKTLIIGVANRGGVISKEWFGVLKEAIALGYDIASGLHNLLTDEDELVAYAKKNHTQLFDVRIPQKDYPIANGVKRKGKRLLCVGTDCSVGKMYTALQLEKDMRALNMNCDFRATGQTGILITGDGVPLDAVVADFMAGSIEDLTPDHDEQHWDLIEGQGSLFHASYSGVTLALIHGGQADALVLCHEPSRQHMRGLPQYSLPGLQECADLALLHAKRVNENVYMAGVAVNTSCYDEETAKAYLRKVEQEMSLPTTDPYRFGTRNIIENLR